MKNETITRGLYFLAGAAAGIAFGMYVNSEKGNALRETLSDHLDDLVQNLSESAQEQLGGLMSTLSTAVENGLAQVANMDDEIEDAATTVGEDIRDAIEDAETTFESGMGKARLRLQQKFAAAGAIPKT
jgi:gas vesicle protein